MILDDKKRPFYWHDNSERHINFNLPPGKYYTRSNIIKLLKFVPYGNKPYPTSSEFKAFLKGIRLFPYPNPSKASISLKNGFILADPKFYFNRYKPLKTFTLCHEVFHFFYHSKTKRQKRNRYIHEFIEMQCDNAAKNFMLANGWNPTQVSLAVKMLLKGQNRKECIREHTTDPKNRYRR